MPEFSKKSESILQTCRPELQKLCREVVKTFDCSVISGRRGMLEQEQLFCEGKTKAIFGNSPHNYGESFAVDLVPYPVDWEDRERMAYFAGYVMRIAEQFGIELKWGGDWDRDKHLSDNRFDDFPHFEIVDWREKVRKH